MKDDDQLKADHESPVRLIIFKPEGEVFQKLHLCEHLRELPEASGEKHEDSGEKDIKF